MKTAKTALGASVARASFALALVACSVGAKDTGPTPSSIGGERTKGETDGGVSTGKTAREAPLAADIAIEDIAVFQGVKIPIVEKGASLRTINAPIVARRPALVRVYVKPAAGSAARELVGELRLRSGTKTLPSITSHQTIAGPSTDADPTTTFNFEIPADQMTVDLEGAVAIRESSGSASPPKGDHPARFPRDGSMERLGTRSSGDSVKVVIVPIRYGADGSQRLPDTSDAQLALYRDVLLRVYPVPAIDISVRAPVTWPNAVLANTDGWDDLVQAMADLRARDNPASDVYYHGIFAPAATYAEYCPKDCNQGQAISVNEDNDPAMRGSVSIAFSRSDAGFPGLFAAITVAHEVGHAHGLSHSFTDRDYPYADGAIGVWGWDIVTKALVAPSHRYDFMSYADLDTKWVSDYSYSRLFRRIANVNGESEQGNASRVGATDSPKTYRFVSVSRDGVLTWGRTITLHAAPRAETHALEFTASDGHVLATGEGHYYSYAEGGGGVLLVPEGPSGFASLTVRELHGAVRRLAAHSARPHARLEPAMP